MSDFEPEMAIVSSSATLRAFTSPVCPVRRSSTKSWKTTASPSDVNCTSHSMAKPPAIAASAAVMVFSMMPFALSWRPRWAIGLATSQFKLLIGLRTSFHFDGGIERELRNSDRRTGMPALVSERSHHQVGGAVHDRRELGEGRGPH